MTIRTQDAKIPPADVPRMSELLAEKVRLMFGILANAGIDVDSLPLPAYWHERKPILMQFGGGRGREGGSAVSKRQKEDIADDADDDDEYSYYRDDGDDDTTRDAGAGPLASVLPPPGISVPAPAGAGQSPTVGETVRTKEEPQKK